MRVAIDYTPAYEQGGGIGRYVRELIAALSRLDTRTQYRLFVSGAAGQMPELTQNFTWRTTRLSPRWLARLWHRARIPLPVEIFTGRIDLFHATDFVLPPLTPGVSSILTVHDLSYLRVPEAASPSLRRYLEHVVPRSAKRATHILADSQATKDDLLDAYDLEPDKVTVLLSGVDKRFRPALGSISDLCQRYALPDRPFVFSLGTVQPRKNYVRLVRAIANLRAQGYDIDLVIAGGKGWLDAPIYQAIADAKIIDHVHMIGFVDEVDLPALYTAASVFAFPSLYEGFGLPVLEAMACGTPVLTSKVSSLPEVAGDAALVVDPYDEEAIADGLKRIIDDDALRAEFIQRGKQRAAHFTWARSAETLLNVYQCVLDQSS